MQLNVKKSGKMLKNKKCYDILYNNKIKIICALKIKRLGGKMKRTIYNILFVVYGIIAITVTICLLSYNQYKITEFGDNSLVLVTNNELKEDFNKGDLVIVNKKDKIEVGDKMFFYNTEDKKVNVDFATVTGKEETTRSKAVYTIEGNYQIPSENVLGSGDDATVIKHAGTVLSVLESKWGFLFLIILPALLMFIHEITKIVVEFRKTPKEG